MENTIPYGKYRIALTNIDGNGIEWITPPIIEAGKDQEAVVRSALSNPISGGWDDIKATNRVTIAINDKTRPVPHKLLIPPLIEQLEQHGISSENITLFFATGTHQPMKPDEMTAVLPKEILGRVKVVSHNVDELDNFIQLGVTSRGTPAVINRQYYESDLRIVVGDIELHHFAGYSGGVKTAVIGLGSREAIHHNHSMLLDENAGIGVYEENPLRQDIEEAGDLIGIHFALNAILNERNEIVEAFFGKPRDVMKLGIPVIRRVSGVKKAKNYDIVIASAGGYPKDINFYQAQKALTHAALFCRPGGTIILVAECIEGGGSRGFEELMRSVSSVAEIYKRFQAQGFIVGPHKAMQLALQLERNKIILVSSLPKDLVKQWLIIPAETVNEALMFAKTGISYSPSIAILPYATSVFPVS